MYNTTNGAILTNANINFMLGEILSNFNTSYIVDVVRDSINMRFRPFNTGMPGISAFEESFNRILNDLEDYSEKQKILDVREATYSNIIDILCRYYNLSYTPDENIDTYSVAYYLYDLLVANFTATIINFFTNFVVRNQDMLFNQLNVSKEDLNNYSKKMYNNSHLSFIHSNLSRVLDNIADIDITMADLIEYGCLDQTAMSLLGYTITENGNIFREHFVPYLKNSSSRADLITSVRLALQQFATADMSVINNMIVRND